MPPNLNPDTIKALRRRLQNITVEIRKLGPLINDVAKDLGAQQARHESLESQRMLLLRERQQITEDMNTGGATS